MASIRYSISSCKSEFYRVFRATKIGRVAATCLWDMSQLHFIVQMALVVGDYF